VPSITDWRGSVRGLLRCGIATCLVSVWGSFGARRSGPAPGYVRSTSGRVGVLCPADPRITIPAGDRGAVASYAYQCERQGHGVRALSNLRCPRAFVEGSSCPRPRTHVVRACAHRVRRRRQAGDCRVSMAQGTFHTSLVDEPTSSRLWRDVGQHKADPSRVPESHVRITPKSTQHTHPHSESDV
jgi:hypothetical protein